MGEEKRRRFDVQQTSSARLELGTLSLCSAALNLNVFYVFCSEWTNMARWKSSLKRSWAFITYSICGWFPAVFISHLVSFYRSRVASPTMERIWRTMDKLVFLSWRVGTQRWPQELRTDLQIRWITCHRNDEFVPLGCTLGLDGAEKHWDGGAELKDKASGFSLFWLNCGDQVNVQDNTSCPTSPQE